MDSDETPVLDDAHGGGNKENRQNGGQKMARLLYLLQLDKPQTQRSEQQQKAVNRSRDGQRYKTLEGLPCKGEAQNDEKLR